ncbi:MAG: zeta toxin family protein [Actinomycetota bacterium]|nr:zeta toxin family protein [Actinomycetota bacterium]
MTEKLEKIIITDEEHHLPYSKGLMATSMMATGLPPEQAYNIASMIHEELSRQGKPEVTMEFVRKTAEMVLEREVGGRFVETYRKWQSLAKLEKPIIIFMGGATGVGKSTVATMLAGRLGITRQVSTDIIREVMRSILDKELVPALYDHSFSAFAALRIPLPETTDKVIVGFLEQAAMVWVGIRALVERAILERTNFIVEGAHLVPGIIDPKFFKDAYIVQFVLAVDDENLHRSHFEIRELETEGARPFIRYLKNFSNIRKIQEYILRLAQEEKVPVFPCYQIDATVGAILEYIINQVFYEYTEGKVREGMVERALEISARRERGFMRPD